MRWKTISLSDCCDVLSGYAFKSSYFGDKGIPIARIRDVVRGYSETMYQGEYKSEYLIDNGDILIGMDGDFNLAKWKGGKALLNQRVCKIIPKAGVIDPQFLFYYLPIALQEIWVETPFVTVKHLSVKKVNSIKVPFPPIAEQKKIAAVLEKADYFRQKSQQMEQELNSLAQSVFLDMFGDPINNSKGWSTYAFKELGELKRGKSKHRPRNDPKLLGGPYPLIQTGDVARADNYITSFKQTYSEIGLQQSKEWDEGTLCITIAANIADTAILSFKACFPDSVVGFNADESITSNVYIHHWLKQYQRVLQDLAPESAQKNINLKILEQVQIFIPPLELQREFILKIEQIEKLKKENKLKTLELNENFNSLMQRAFKGELDLKDVA